MEKLATRKSNHSQLKDGFYIDTLDCSFHEQYNTSFLVNGHKLVTLTSRNRLSSYILYMGLNVDFGTTNLCNIAKRIHLRRVKIELPTEVRTLGEHQP